MQISIDIDAIDPEELEWVEWYGPAADEELANGRPIRVQHGDVLLAWVNHLGVAFLDHKPITRH